MEVELGDQVKDKVTGFVGIAVARTEFLSNINNRQKLSTH